MSCSAKISIYAFFTAAFFPQYGALVMIALYLLGILIGIVAALIMNHTAFRGKPVPFVMELPAYHAPTAVNILRGTWERGWSFIKKAGTVILLASIFVWFTKSFGFVDGSFGMVEDMDASILAAIGSFVAPIFAPLGFGNWQSTVASVLGLVAKEEVVGVFGVLYGVAGDALELVEEGAFNELGPIAQHFTALSAYSFLIFNLLCAPCFAAIGAIKREMNNPKWTWFAIGYQTVFAYTIALIVYQLGLLFTGGSFGIGTIAALVLLAAYIWLLVRKGYVGETKSASSIEAAKVGVK